MSTNLTLVSFGLCPYVQRAAIALNEKGVSFKRIDVDLANKPDWFKVISPLGKVPLLQIGEEVLFESTVIVEYLDETQGMPLHPADPLTRARHRAWMEFGGAVLMDIWAVETTPDAEAFHAKLAALRDKFARLESVLGEGPYFAGARFSLVDAVFAPAFRYFEVLDRIADFGLFADLPKLAAWRQALASRPSVRAAVAPDYAAKLVAWLREQPSHLATLMPQALAA